MPSGRNSRNRQSDTKRGQRTRGGVTSLNANAGKRSKSCNNKHTSSPTFRPILLSKSGPPLPVAIMSSETDALLPSVITRSSASISSSSSSNSLLDGDGSSLRYTSCKAAVFLTVNACLGAGLLNMPYAFQSGGGLLTGTITQLILVVIVGLGMGILTYCTHVSGAQSFQQLVKFFAGQKTASMTSISIILYSYGACLTFIIIIGDQVDRVLASVYGPDFCQLWYLSRPFTMTAVSLLLILPMSFSRGINFLTFSSMALLNQVLSIRSNIVLVLTVFAVSFSSLILSSCGVFVVGYIIFLSFYEWLHLQEVDFEQLSVVRDEAAAATIHYTDTSVTRLVPAIVFAYQCHLSWVPTYAGMREPCHSKKLIFTIVLSFLICLMAYQAIAVFGVLTFADLLDSDLMLNYDASKPLVMIGIAAIVFKTVTTYPLILFPARLAIDDTIVKLYQIQQPEQSELKRRIIIVLVWFLSTLVLAIFVPDISSTISMMGSLAVIFTLIIPGICLISAAEKMHAVISDQRLLLMNITGAAILLFGAFVFGLTTSELILVHFFAPSHPTLAAKLCPS